MPLSSSAHFGLYWFLLFILYCFLESKLPSLKNMTAGYIVANLKRSYISWERLIRSKIHLRSNKDMYKAGIITAKLLKCLLQCSKEKKTLFRETVSAWKSCCIVRLLMVYSVCAKILQLEGFWGRVEHLCLLLRVS